MVPKFRVWDEIQHKMLQVDYIEFIDGKAYWVEASSADDNPQGGNDGPVRDNSQLKLEQSTGLKDVNGKEIYEGDIVRYTRWTDKVGIVEYIQPEFELRNIGVNFDISPTLSMNHEMKVIGNVHENPELLEAE
ncbi:YopX family protein [Levilactobacillus brevis]